MIKAFVLSLCFISNSFAFTSDSTIDRGTTLTFSSGATQYFGSLAPFRFLGASLGANARWNFATSIKKKVNNVIDIELGYSQLRIAGDEFILGKRNIDKFYQLYLRNLHFRNDISEFSLLINAESLNKKRLSLNAGLGFGAIIHEPKALYHNPNTLENEWVKLREVVTTRTNYDILARETNYSRYALVFPLKLGLSYDLSDRLKVSSVLNFRFTNTPWLDDVGPGDFFRRNSNALIEQKELSDRGWENVHILSGESRKEQVLEIYDDYFRIGGMTEIDPTFVTKNLWNRGNDRPDVFLSFNIGLEYKLREKNKPWSVKRKVKSKSLINDANDESFRIIGLRTLSFSSIDEELLHGYGIYYEFGVTKNDKLSVFLPLDIFLEDEGIPEFQFRPLLNAYPFGSDKLFAWSVGVGPYLTLNPDYSAYELGFNLQNALNLNINKVGLRLSGTFGRPISPYPYLAIGFDASVFYKLRE